MLKAIKNAVTAIYDFITTVVGFIVDFIADIVNVIEMLADAVLSIPDYFDWLPPSVAALIISAFAVIVIYKVTARD